MRSLFFITLVLGLVPCQPGIDKFLGLLSNPGGFTRILRRSPIMNKKFVVRLSIEERGQLESLVAKGKAAARQLTRARILLKADCSPLGPAWSDEQISNAPDLGAMAVHRVRRSFVEGGLDGVLVRRRVPRRPRLLDGDQEAHLIALPCGSPPAASRGPEPLPLHRVAGPDAAPRVAGAAGPGLSFAGGRRPAQGERPSHDQGRLRPEARGRGHLQREPLRGAEPHTAAR